MCCSFPSILGIRHSSWRFSSVQNKLPSSLAINSLAPQISMLEGMFFYGYRVKSNSRASWLCAVALCSSPMRLFKLSLLSHWRCVDSYPERAAHSFFSTQRTFFCSWMFARPGQVCLSAWFSLSKLVTFNDVAAARWFVVITLKRWSRSK